jgi:hypothetical protein
VHRPDLWAEWFRDAAEPGMFAVFVHRSDAQPGNALRGVGATLIAPLLQPGVDAGGKFAIVRVHHALATAAMAHSRNVAKVVFLSADCVPVQRFSAVYAALAASPARGVLAWETPNANHTTRDSPGMAARRAAHWPRGWGWTWLVASQWSVLARHHVAALVEHWGPLQATFDAGDKEPVEVPDEHALVVLFSALGLLDSFDRRPFMYVDWDEDKEVDNDCGLHDDHTPGDSPYIFHAGGDLLRGLRRAQACGALFLREVCERGDVGIPWSVK